MIKLQTSFKQKKIYQILIICVVPNFFIKAGTSLIKTQTEKSWSLTTKAFINTENWKKLFVLVWTKEEHTFS